MRASSPHGGQDGRSPRIGNNQINSAQPVTPPIRGLNKAYIGIRQRKAQATLIVSLTVALVKLTS